MTRRANRRQVRRRRSSRPGRSLSGSDRTERVPGKMLVPVALFSTAIPLTVNAFGIRLTTIGSTFQEHRFTSIRVVLHPGYVAGLTARASYAVGYFKNIPQVPPTTATNLYQGTVSRYSDLGDTVPVVLNMNRAVLLSNVRNWYTNNTASGTENLDNTQGVLYVIGAGSEAAGFTANLEITYLCEFRGATLPPVQ